MSWQEAGRAHASDLPRADYGKLYNVVDSMFGGPLNDETAHKQMIEQLQPTQRCALPKEPGDCASAPAMSKLKHSTVVHLLVGVTNVVMHRNIGGLPCW